MEITLGQQYNVGEKHTVMLYIAREGLGGIQGEKKKKEKKVEDKSQVLSFS